MRVFSRSVIILRKCSEDMLGYGGIHRRATLVHYCNSRTQPEPLRTSMLNFKFISKYQKGAVTPHFFILLQYTINKRVGLSRKGTNNLLINEFHEGNSKL